MKISIKKIKSILFKNIKVNNYILISSLAVVLFSGATIFFWPQIKQVKLFNNKNESSVQSELAQLREQIKLLSKDNNDTNSINNSNVSVATTQQLQSKIKELSIQPKQKVNVIGSSNSTYNSFIPYIVQIFCLNSDGSGNYGSGTIISPNTILSNYHVIKGYRQCLVSFTNSAGDIGAETVTGTIARIDQSRDRAIINVDSSLANKTIKKCNAGDVKIGDDLRIMGYPDVGGSKNISLTSGIVSSFETGYIITDAKASYGSSGGAAIHNSGCFLGIPTGFSSTGLDGFLYIVDERIGSGLNDAMQSVENNEQYQQDVNDVIEQKQMDAAKIKDKSDYDFFVSKYNNVLSGYDDNDSKIQTAIDLIVNNKFDDAIYSLEQIEKSINRSKEDLIYFNNFSVFQDIDTIENKFYVSFNNLTGIANNLRDAIVYKKGGNYNSALASLDKATEYDKKATTDINQVKSLFYSMNTYANNYFNQ